MSQFVNMLKHTAAHTVSTLVSWPHSMALWLTSQAILSSLSPWIRYMALRSISRVAPAALHTQIRRRYAEYETSVMDHERFRRNFESLYNESTYVHLPIIHALDLLQEWKKTRNNNYIDILWNFFMETMCAERLSTFSVLQDCSKVYLEYLDTVFDTAQCDPQTGLALSLGFDARRYSNLHVNDWKRAGGIVTDAHLRTFRWLDIDDVKDCISDIHDSDRRLFLFQLAVQSNLDDDVKDELERCLTDGKFARNYVKYASDVCMTQSIANYVVACYMQHIAGCLKAPSACVSERTRRFNRECKQKRFIHENGTMVELFTKLAQENVYKPVDLQQITRCLMALPYSDEEKADFDNHLASLFKGQMTKAAR